MRDATLCYIFNNGKVLLQKKSSGKFGEGKWNAPGGKIEKRENPENAAIREVKEETGLAVKNVQKIGLLAFAEEGGKLFSAHIFVTDNFSGEIKESEEGELKWFDTKSIPYQEMWEDDKVWFPYLLKKQKFKGAFLFTKGFKKLIRQKVERADSL